MRIKIYRFLCLIITPIYPFTTLEKLVEYTHSMPEHPPVMQNSNWLDPNYTNFYKRTLPNILTIIGYKLGFIPEPQWNIDQLFGLLRELQPPSVASGTGHELQTVLFKAAPGSRLYIWGALYGSLDSFVRALEFLHAEKVIDHEFNIIDPKAYFVFNGNLIDRSAYTLETLTIVLLLLKKNPGRVWYIRGTHETNNYWHDYSTKRELLVYGKKLIDSGIDLLGLVSNFFDSLPVSLIVTAQDPLAEYTLIAPNLENPVLPASDVLEKFLQKNTPGEVSFASIVETQKKRLYPSMQAIIKSDDLVSAYKVEKGLMLVEPYQWATTWSTVSHQNQAYQYLYKFMDDAFTVFTVGEHLGDSTLTLYSRDTRTDNPFKIAGIYDLLSGYDIHNPPPGTTCPTKKPITLGTTLNISGVTRDVGLNVQRGILAALNAINSNGGINGRRVRLVIFDDHYSDTEAFENVRIMRSQNIRTIVLPVGTAMVHSFSAYARDNNMGIVFPITGAQFLRDPEKKYVINLRASYTQELELLIKTLRSLYNIQRMSALYQQDTYGTTTFENLQQVMAAYRMGDPTGISFALATVVFKKQIAIMLDGQSDTLCFIANSNSAQDFVRQIGVEYLSGIRLCGISNQITLERYIKSQGLSAVFSAVFPNPDSSTMPIVKEYKKIMADQHMNINTDGLEGYVGMYIILDALKRVKDPEDPAELIHELEQYSHKNFGGLSLNFDLKTRQLMHEAWVHTI